MKCTSLPINSPHVCLASESNLLVDSSLRAIGVRDVEEFLLTSTLVVRIQFSAGIARWRLFADEMCEFGGGRATITVAIKVI